MSRGNHFFLRVYSSSTRAIAIMKNGFRPTGFSAAGEYSVQGSRQGEALSATHSFDRPTGDYNGIYSRLAYELRFSLALHQDRAIFLRLTLDQLLTAISGKISCPGRIMRAYCGGKRRAVWRVGEVGKSGEFFFIWMRSAHRWGLWWKLLNDL